MKSEELVKMLPDAYKKDNNSNNLKMFKLLDDHIEEIILTQNRIREYHSLELAKGKALDMFGENLGVERKGLSDEVYKVILKAKTIKNQGTGSFNNTTELIAYALNTDIKNIRLSEDYETGGRSGYITINNLPLTILNNIGMSIQEYEDMLKGVIPIGLGLSVTNLEGTFAFAFGDGTVMETDSNTGFANDEQTIGGTLGATVGSTIAYSIIKMPTYGVIEFSQVGSSTTKLEGVTVQGEYILIENDSELQSFIFEITAEEATYKFIASKISLSYWGYSQELSIEAPVDAGDITLNKPSQYIVVDTAKRTISIQNNATTYDDELGVIPLTEFGFYEESDGVRTNYKATLNNEVWTYQTI